MRLPSPIELVDNVEIGHFRARIFTVLWKSRHFSDTVGYMYGQSAPWIDCLIPCCG